MGTQMVSQGMMMGRRRAKAMTAAGALLCLFGAFGTATARDASPAEFFIEQFNLATRPQPPVWAEDNPFDRPLVVRPHRRKPRFARVESPAAKGPIAPVSIYEDKTLRRGDAVMTARGIRIFKGSNTMPYRESDFVAVSEQPGLSRDVQKTLIAMDHVSRN